MNTSPDMQAINNLRQNGNLWGKELLQADPQMVARIQAWAEQTGQALNWNLPLVPNIMEKSSGPIEIVTQYLEGDTIVYTAVPNAPAERALTYYFAFASYVTRITASAPGLKLAPSMFENPPNPAFSASRRLPGPDPSYQRNINPLDYIEVKIRRLNTENVTISDDNADFIALSSIAGDGQSPYATDLTLPFRQAENLVINVRVRPEVLAVNSIKIQLHMLRLPIGMTVRGASGQ